MSRTTRAQVESAFAMLCTMMGKRVATSYRDVGSWALDHSATYGGYVIVEIANNAGGQVLPFGDERHTASVFYDMCHFARTAVKIASSK